MGPLQHWNAPLWGNPLLPHGRQEGDRAGLEHEHPDLTEYRDLRTLGNLVRARAELGRVTAGWDAVPGEWTPREARRAFVNECLDPVEGGDRWWDWRRWEECGQDLVDLESKEPVEWKAAARAGPAQNMSIPCLFLEPHHAKAPWGRSKAEKRGQGQLWSWE